MGGGGAGHRPQAQCPHIIGPLCQHCRLCRNYWLANFNSEAAAAEAGYSVTHAGHCGSCSSLQDLGVYLGRNLTEPTRRCGALSIVSADLMRKCLQRIGFSDNCIPIWEYNILNTRQECTRVIEDIYFKSIKYFWVNE